MVPLVADVRELVNQTAPEFAKSRRSVFHREGRAVPYLIGTMIELRARAGGRPTEIAKEAEFFSFGTNDLTQTTFGLRATTRGDSRVLNRRARRLLPDDPFPGSRPGRRRQAHRDGGEARRNTRRDLKVGICGEHGGEPELREVLSPFRMNYVSCSPFRVPIARLAAAQAALEEAGSSVERELRQAIATRVASSVSGTGVLSLPVVFGRRDRFVHAISFSEGNHRPTPSSPSYRKR